MTKDEFNERLKKHGLEHYKERFLAAAKPCIRLHLTKKDDADIPNGVSKMGGDPDLPDSIPWPYETERPLSAQDRFFNILREPKPLLPLLFVAQIDLAEVSPFDETRLLPQTGLLYFFFSDEQPWGFDPQDQDGFKVLYFDGDRSELVRRPLPDAPFEGGKFDPCIITPKADLSLPDHYEPDFMSDEEWDRYFDVVNEFPVNKMLGHADVIQGEMEIECEMVTRGIYMGAPTPENDPVPKAARERAGDWLLLLQVDSNEDACKMMWGDVGRIYYWIRKEDLQKRDFTKTWLILQCT